MKRLFTRTLLFMSVFMVNNITQAADMGPYYITYDDFCEVYEIYITPDLNIYGRETGCERESVIVSGQLGDDESMPLHYQADNGEYIDVVNLSTGTSFLYYNNGSSIDFIVESQWKLKNDMTSSESYN